MISQRKKADKAESTSRHVPPAVLASALAIVAAIYYWIFSLYDVLPGALTADGEPLSRLVFLGRILFPDEWIAEMTGSGRFPLGILDRGPVLLAAIAGLGLAFFVGAPCTYWGLRGIALSSLERIALSALTGLSLLSTATLGLGLCGLSASRWAHVALFGFLAVAAWCWSRRMPSSPTQSLAPAWYPPTDQVLGTFVQLGGRLVPVLVCCLAAIYCLSMLQPPFEFDVVEYHLQTAKEFYQQGGIRYNDHNVYANMPMGLEMHCLAAMSLVNGPDGWWWGGLIGKVIVGSISLLAAMLLGGYVSRLCGQLAGWSAAGLWLAVPGNAHVAGAGLIDSAVAAYLLAATICGTLLWQQASEKQSSPLSLGLVFLLFVYCGTTAAAKYTGLVFVVLPGCIAMLWIAASANSVRSHSRQWLGIAAVAATALVLTALPWYLKNWALIGNPVFPLGYAVFGASNFDAAQAEQWARAHRPQASGGQPYSLAAVIESLRQLLLTSEFALPSLWILLVVGISAAWRQYKWSIGWLALMVWGYGVWWLATHRLDRFWLPLLPIECVLAGIGFAAVAKQVSAKLAVSLVLVGLLYGAIINSSPVLGDNRFLVLLDALRNDGGDEHTVGRLSPSIAWCNQNLSPEHRLLLIGEARVFDFRNPIIYSTCFDRSPAELWLRDRTLNEQREHLRQAGVTHLMVSWSELARYRSPGNYGFSSWPVPGDFEQMVASGLLRPVAWGLDDRSHQLFEVNQAP